MINLNHFFPLKCFSLDQNIESRNEYTEEYDSYNDIDNYGEEDNYDENYTEVGFQEILAGSLNHFTGEPDRGEPTFHQ